MLQKLFFAEWNEIVYIFDSVDCDSKSFTIKLIIGRISFFRIRRPTGTFSLY